MRKRSLLLALLALLGLGVPAQAGSGDGSSFGSYSYTNDQGTRTYMVYVPAGVRPGAPLIVDLPGCSETAAVEARRSRFNEVAARVGAVVAYPEQDPAANGGRCWNWFLPEHQSRGLGEASIIAGITRTVQARWRTDVRRTYVFGISAGAAMANVMAVAYPDLYAAVGVYAGCPYKALPCLASAPAHPWLVSAQLAAEQMGPRLRVVPLFVVQGDADVLVPLANSVYVVQQWLAIDEIAMGRSPHTGVWMPDQQRRGRKPGPAGRAFTVSSWHDARGCELAEMWTVHGMGHAWSNAQNSGDPVKDAESNDLLLNDPDGPDVTTAAMKFFLQHRMPVIGRGCAH